MSTSATVFMRLFFFFFFFFLPLALLLFFFLSNFDLFVSRKIKNSKEGGTGATMEDRKEGKGRLSVPAFGEWDMKNGMPDYSMDFTKLREMRLQNKTSGGLSYGNEDEMLYLQGSGGDTRKDGKGGATSIRRRAPAAEEQEEEDDDHRRPINDHHQHRSPTGRKRFINYFQCCIGA